MKLVFRTPENDHYFFGYWDKSPLDFSSERLLVCKPKFIHRMPEPNDVLEIGFFNWKESNDFIKVAETKAWNWQQGCMLQWLDSSTQNTIIYNDRIDNKFVSIIYDIETQSRTVLEMAYYAASSDGEFLLCIDNERHCFYRPSYSYVGINNKEKHKKFLGTDGIWRLDIKSQKLTQIISLNEMIDISPNSSMEEATHYLEHLLINTCNKRFLFLHRWVTSDGMIYSRLYSANTDGSDKFLLNDSGRMSHNCWKNNNTIVGWGGMGGAISDLRKHRGIIGYLVTLLTPIYRYLVRGNPVNGNTKLSRFVTGDSYLIFHDKSNKKARLDQNKLIKDGHPSFSPINDNLMVTDSYPDSNNNYKEDLILYDTDAKEILSILELDHPEEYAKSAVRCDLHPKWSHDGNYICIDTLEKSRRRIYVYQV